jgi:hypothetical protein
MSVEQTEQQAAQHTKAPRVSLADIENSIETVAYLSGATILSHADYVFNARKGEDAVLHVAHVTLCMVVMKNGFVVFGTSAPASPENFDKAFGQKLAYEDCIRQLWKLMGFALRDTLHKS